MNHLQLPSEPRDKGIVGTQLNQMVLQTETPAAYLSVHTLINSRAYASTRFIYRHLLPRIQKNKTAIVLLPIARTWAKGEATVENLESSIDHYKYYCTLADSLAREEKSYLRDWREIHKRLGCKLDLDTLFVTDTLTADYSRRSLPEKAIGNIKNKLALASFLCKCDLAEAGMIVQNDFPELSENLELLDNIRNLLSSQLKPITVPLVVLVDIPTPLTQLQERKLIQFMRDAAQLRAVVWLHTLCTTLSKSLISSFGNFIFFHASSSEIDIIRKVLPRPQKLDFKKLPGKALVYTPTLGLDCSELFDLGDDNENAKDS